MKFALVEGGRREATPASRGECPMCGVAVISKCGTKKLWHWAHRSVQICDHWWESETEWHRAWKNEFPASYQEVRCVAPGGELHIADVRTEAGIVLEFQHSDISASERASRENFYGRMVWIVDGGRGKNDSPKFEAAVRNAIVIEDAPLRLLMSGRANPVLERWAGSRRPVFVDFGEAQSDLSFVAREKVLWYSPRRITDFKSRIFSGFMIEEILMKTSRFSEPQILAILRQAEGGVAVPDLCREHGMSTASFYKWRAKYGGMDASMISQMKALEDENRRLKKMYAEMSMQAELLKEALGKK
ncbi:transposase-like protein [Ensifer sp. 4252]